MKSKHWREFECPNESFGLVVIDKEMVLVGGLDKSGVPTNKVARFSIEMGRVDIPPNEQTSS